MAKGGKKVHQAAVRMDEKTMAALVEEADREERSVAAMLRILVREALAAREVKEKRKEPTGRKR
jgi:hypothetical protein